MSERQSPSPFAQCHLDVSRITSGPRRHCRCGIADPRAVQGSSHLPIRILGQIQGTCERSLSRTFAPFCPISCLECRALSSRHCHIYAKIPGDSRHTGNVSPSSRDLVQQTLGCCTCTAHITFDTRHCGQRSSRYATLATACGEN